MSAVLRHLFRLRFVKPLGALLCKEYLDRTNDDLEIKKDAVILYVHEIQLQFVVSRSVVLAVDLSKAGEAALNSQTVRKLRDLLRILFDMFDPLRSGTDHAHVSFQDVDELRKLVEPRRTDHIADLCDTGIALRRGNGDAALLRIYDHRTELEDLEDPAALGTALLLEKDRSVVLELDRDSDDEEER